jgi:hypothetical protein
MKPEDKITRERLTSSIDKCFIHWERIEYALQQIQDLFPMDATNYLSLTEVQIAWMDQIIFRFTKIQDEIGQNTFRFLLEYLQEDFQNKPFKDILNTLERLEYIDSANTWLSLRELRNDLTHDYPKLIDETTDKLNHLFHELSTMKHILNTIKDKCK